jgi:hypothetical protein
MQPLSGKAFEESMHTRLAKFFAASIDPSSDASYEAPNARGTKFKNRIDSHFCSSIHSFSSFTLFFTVFFSVSDL